MSYLFFLLVAILGFIFSVLNSEPVLLKYYVGQQQIPLAFVVLGAVFIGCVLGLLVGSVWVLRLLRRNRELRHKFSLVEKEVENLRSLPLKDNH
jgi:putative membrane protein